MTTSTPEQLSGTSNGALHILRNARGSVEWMIRALESGNNSERAYGYVEALLASIQRDLQIERDHAARLHAPKSDGA